MKEKPRSTLMVLIPEGLKKKFRRVAKGQRRSMSMAAVLLIEREVARAEKAEE